MTKFRKPDCQYFPACGGCDFLDLDEENYRIEKSLFLQRTLQNVKASEIDWIWLERRSRRRITLQIDAKNNLGFFSKKSNSLIKIDECLASEDDISNFISPLKNFLKNQQQNLFQQAQITLFDNGLDIIFTLKKEPDFTQFQKIIAFAKENNVNISHKINGEFSTIFLARKNQIFFDNFKIDLDSNIFIQATKSGLTAITKIIRNYISQNKSIQKIADIYAGFGAYSFAISDLIKSVSAFEGDKKMVDSINKNAASNDLNIKIRAEIRDLFSNPLDKNELKKLDFAIINPPRNGATPQVEQIAKSSLKKLLYVSCNPQSFAFDARILIDCGFTLTKITALDQFYATKHLELIAIFERE